MKHPKLKGEEVFFVGVRDPVELRKEVLGCAKDCIGNLRAFERFKDARKQKVEMSTKLKKHVDELLMLTNRLKKKLPESHMRAIAKAEAMDLGITIREDKPRRKSSSALDKLDQELAQLESKLKQIK
jgi:hypothetical protein